MISFAHHTFSEHETSGPVEFVGAASAIAVAEPTAADIGDVPDLLRRAGVTEIILVHGTFAGNDIVGIARSIARLAPGFGRQLSQLGKRWFDELVGEVGNYTESFAECLSRLINPPESSEIQIRRFHWSGENHHLGRADAAMSLLDSMLNETETPGGRRLIWAHSHGGNVVDIVTQLLGADVPTRRSFFESTRLHYRNPWTGKIDLPNWRRVAERLRDEPELKIPPHDVVTFGTPLRYRWNTGVCPKLLHFVQHRPTASAAGEAALAKLPGSIRDAMGAVGGDYVQHVGIAGTDFPPSLFAWREWVVERRMRRILEPHARRRDMIKNLKLGRRASCEGTTLLVDYAETDAQLHRKLFGHGVYTCRQWLPFHLREITERFYPLEQ